jgi:cytochrome c
MVALLGAATCLMPTAVHAFTDDDIRGILKKSNCFKCHSELENKAKDAPSFKELADDVRKRPNREDRFYKRVTTKTTAEVKGKEVDHEPLKTKNEAEIRAVVKWLLSR